jgi:hypothetical protein
MAERPLSAQRGGDSKREQTQGPPVITADAAIEPMEVEPDTTSPDCMISLSIHTFNLIAELWKQAGSRLSVFFLGAKECVCAFPIIGQKNQQLIIDYYSHTLSPLPLSHIGLRQLD